MLCIPDHVHLEAGVELTGAAELVGSVGTPRSVRGQCRCSDVGHRIPVLGGFPVKSHLPTVWDAVQLESRLEHDGQLCSFALELSQASLLHRML